MKKNRKRAVSIALSLVLAMTAVNITGCGKKADSTNGELNLFIWTEYVPDEVIKDFEKEMYTNGKMTTNTMESYTLTIRLWNMNRKR